MSTGEEEEGRGGEEEGASSLLKKYDKWVGFYKRGMVLSKMWGKCE